MYRSNTAPVIRVESATDLPDRRVRVELHPRDVFDFAPGFDVSILRPGHRRPERGRVVSQFEIERAEMYDGQNVIVGVEAAIIELDES